MNKNSKKRYKNISYFKAKRCPFCKSEKVIKWGYRYNHVTKKQRYKCNKCKESFVVDDGFFKMKKPREFITQCVDLYVNGLSVRKVKTHIEQFSETEISHTAIMKWLHKYSKIVKSFTDRLPINISGIYHADEIYIKVNGKQNYFFDLIDAETRFLVATNYDKEKGLDGANGLFKKAKKRAEKPLCVYTDGLPAYVNIVPKTWWTMKGSREEFVEHIRIIEKGDYRNNIIERIQGTLRERIKVMRGFGSMESAELILNLIVTYYNFLKIHQGIGCTPAERCGIKLNLGKNKWLGLIYRSKIN